MKRVTATIATAVALATCLGGCMPAGAVPVDYYNLDLIQLKQPEEGMTVATVCTNMGEFSMMLFEEEAPNATAQFIQLVEDGYYNQKTVYSVTAENKLAWIGATDETGETGQVADENAEPIEVEFSADLWHFTGAVSTYGEDEGMFSSGVKADSRFFIVGHSEPTAEVVEQLESYGYPEEVISTYKEVGGQPTYTGQYTVFAHVYDGMDVVEDIIAVTTEEVYDYIYTPVEDIVIENITLSTYSAD